MLKISEFISLLLISSINSQLRNGFSGFINIFFKVSVSNAIKQRSLVLMSRVFGAFDDEIKENPHTVHCSHKDL